MKRILLIALVICMISSMFTGAFAKTVYCSTCGKNVTGTNERCSGDRLYYSSWTACDRGNGCLNYRFVVFITAYSCPKHGGEIQNGSHTEGTDHEVSSHNRNNCPY